MGEIELTHLTANYSAVIAKYRSKFSAERERVTAAYMLTRFMVRNRDCMLIVTIFVLWTISKKWEGSPFIKERYSEHDLT